ncbi:nuclear transport factor 2 family protein [Xanthomonas sacchari]|uniref:nuclear transport factor 2 family protein n=1 Tax=Xanthomonas sacchari TaxID=56458 RepID=UPI0005821F5D|nr:nuclear transport factor 2 family protein [Xanthomonas sacchari]AJC46529.1 hypothetical protein SB85_12950 [Xanthomonas sacchari]
MRFLLAMSLCLSAFGAVAGQSPVSTVQTFYAWAIAPEHADGDVAQVRKLMGRELFAALEAQRAYEAACAKRVPADVKPHMLDQSPFFLWPDQPTALVSTTAQVKGDTARVRARLAVDGLQWTDTVVLGRQDDRWVILDIAWQEGSLTQRLSEFAAQRCTP